jgi:hypothetical protein
MADAAKTFYGAVYYPEFPEGKEIPELRLSHIEDPASKTTKWSDGNVQWMRTGTKVPPTVQTALVALNRGIISEDGIRTRAC